MIELPEVARRRLSRAAASEGHPDAGLLTAFVEGTLARGHRDQVLNHLVACSDCNRLVALVAPQQDVAPAVQLVPERRSWFAWAPLRWASAAAAAAVVVSVVWIGRIDRSARVPASAPVAAEKNSPPSMTAQLPPATAAVSPRKPAANQRQQPERELAKAPAAPAQPVTPPAAQPVAPSAVPDAIYAESRPAVPGNVGDRSAFETSIITGLAPESSFPPADAEPLHPLLKPEVAPVAQSSVPSVPARAGGAVWSVSDTGVLQRSSDSGQTWATVPVPARLPLRVVSVIGGEIWVGGDGGALFHSGDTGHNWVTVTPTSDGRTLSGDIVRMAFLDPRQGWVATRNGEIWITRDGGATWSVKQD